MTSPPFVKLFQLYSYVQLIILRIPPLYVEITIRKGKWKITKIEPTLSKGAFELFNMEEDPTESQNLSAQYPDRYQEMLGHWKAYVKDNGVILANQ